MNRSVTVLAMSVGLFGCTAGPHELNDVVIIPVTLEHGLIFLDLELAGHGPLLALLDTGANASAIDPRKSGHLRATEASTVLGTTGTIGVETVMVEGLRIGSLSLPSLRATRRNLGGLLAPHGREIDMILGSDAFSNLVVTIDFAAGQIEASKQSPGELPAAVPMVLDDGIPAIRGEIAGIDVWLRIDTGASLFETADVYINIPTRTWQALRSQQEGITPSTYFKGTGTDGRVVDLPVAPVLGARVGPLVLDRVFVVVQPEVGYFATPEAKGFVSNNYLRQLGRVTFDYKGGTVAGTVILCCPHDTLEKQWLQWLIFRERAEEAKLWERRQVTPS
jgi:hypothetical protein